MRSRELSCSKSEQSGMPIGQIGGVSCALPCWRVPSEKWSSSPTGEIDFVLKQQQTQLKKMSFHLRRTQID
uniref:Uncharacterized protein n=1 Tax=Brassica oleracea TaxID=3712 RepID=A0A3P6CW84_BRAOL|nr:unnamed protein product [Brassica oleracea]